MSENGGFLALTGTTNLRQSLEADSRALQAGADSVTRLIDLVQDDQAAAESRWRAAICLGKIGDRRAVEVLLTATRDPAWEMRHSAFWSLCQIGDPRAFEAIRAVCTLGGLDEQVNYVAAIGLSRQYGTHGADTLRENLTSADDAVRSWARAALANMNYL